MKVLLLNSQCTLYGSPPCYPFGLAYVANSININYSVEVIDCNITKITDIELCDKIIKDNIAVVGFSGFLSSTYKFIKTMVPLIKKETNAKVIVGGIVSNLYELLIKKAGVDIVCMGEGEKILPMVLQTIEDGGDLSLCPGIVFMNGDKIVKTPLPALIKDIDKVSMDIFKVIPPELYITNSVNEVFIKDPRSKVFLEQGGRGFEIKFSRGCSNRCTFCYRHIKGVRKHSVDLVAAHVKFLYKNNNIRFFENTDEMFVFDRVWLEELRDRLRKEDIKILFLIRGARVDQVNKDILLLLKEMGCVGVIYGFESGSQKMLDTMKKRTTVKQNIEAAKITQELGLFTAVQLVIGFPGEDLETIKETDKFLKEVKVEEISVNYLIPFPGTEIYQTAIEKNMITDEEEYIMRLDDYEMLGSVSRYNFSDIPEYRFKRITRILIWKNNIYTKGFIGFLCWFVKVYSLAAFKKITARVHSFN